MTARGGGSNDTGRRIGRRTVLGGAGAAALGLAGCSLGSDTPAAPSSKRSGPVLVRADAADVALRTSPGAAVAASRALLSRATSVVVTGSTPADVSLGTAAAKALGIPALPAGAGLAGELARLGTRTVVAYGTTDVPGGVEVLRPKGQATPDIDGLPHRPGRGTVVALVHKGTTVPPELSAVLASAGASLVTVDAADMRASTDAIGAVRAARDAPVVAIGFEVGDEDLTARVRLMRTGPQLPGGGMLVFPSHHVVALYGHPSGAALGLLGEQSASASVTRVKKLTDQYAGLLGGPVLPAFEIIATVASGSRLDGSYSSKTPLSQLTPWLDVAEKAGVYTVLDLQPGRDDFLSQAKRYEPLLTRPWVGLALDPEWRLGPNQKPLQQIGSVDASEINETSAWLADLVTAHDLPPKVFTVHQFQTRMVRNRSQLVTDHDQLQVVIHVDGQGSQPDKQGTWKAIRQGLPADVFLGWKNFVDEDHPMLTPQQTVHDVSPVPNLITYQ